MTRGQINAMLKAVGLPVAYDHFDTNDDDRPSGPPFICFLYPNRDDFAADNRNYVRITALRVELYTDAPSFDLEDSLEAALDAAELAYSKSGPDYIDDERMYITTYETEVILNGE